MSQSGGAVSLETGNQRRALPRGLPVRIGAYTLTADGPPGRAVLTVFGPRRSSKTATYYSAGSPLVFVGPLHPPDHPGTVRVLGVDGVEVEAAEAGTVVVPIERVRTRLLVRRLPTTGGEESELEIFFRDETNGKGTYPAGRFVSLIPPARVAIGSTSTARAIPSAPTAPPTRARPRGRATASRPRSPRASDTTGTG